METKGGVFERTVARVASNFGQKSPEQIAEEKAVEKALNIYKYCLGGIKDKQYQWLLNDNAYFNRQNIKYNLTTRTLEPVPANGSEDRINVNKVKQLHRGIVSYLNREHPMIDIRPGAQSDQAYSKSRKEQHLAEYWYEHLQMNKKTKLITGAGARYGVGWVKIAWDDQVLAPTTPFKVENEAEERRHLKGEVMFEHCDTWEILADPLSIDKQNMRFVVHAMPRTIGELKNNKDFKNVELAADKKLSVSPYRNAILNSQTINKLVPGSSDMETVMILEVFRRDFKDGQPCIYKTVITESGVLLQDIEWPMDEFPFEYYQTDTASAIYESEGVIKDVRDLIRSMNINASGVQEAVRVMGKLNWLVAKGSGVNVIRDKTGDFVEYNPNSPRPEQARPSQLPQYVEQHNANLERWINDQGGTHDAFNGNSPYGRASGEAINKLQEGDSNALAMMRDNLDDFLARSFKLLFKTFKQNGGEGDRYFRMKDDSSLADSWISVKPSDISVDDDIKIKSGTALPYSQSAKISLVTELFKEKIIDDPKAALRMMGLSEIDNVNGSEQLDIDRQTEELKQMIGGKELDDPIIAEDHNVHIRVVDNYIKTPDFKKLKPKIQQMILDHRSAHVKLSIQLAKMHSAMQVEPIKRSETLMVRASSLAEFTPQERHEYFDKFAVDSDSLEIQKRGGLEVQDPNAAVNQAHAENTQMAEEGDPVHISAFDNHKVHLEVHNALMASDEFATLTSPNQNMIRAHVKQHEQMLTAQTPGQGLIPNGQNDGVPVPDHKLVTASAKRRAMLQAARQQANANMPHQG